MFIGCIITGVQIAAADSDLEEFCDSTFRNPSNNEACEQLENIQRLVIAFTVSIQSLVYTLSVSSCVYFTHAGN